MWKVMITALLFVAVAMAIDSLLLAPHRQLQYQSGRHPRPAEDRFDPRIDPVATQPSTLPSATRACPGVAASKAPW